MEGLKFRTSLAILGIIGSIIWVAPNFVEFGKSWWPTTKKLNYGLDIQGGLHLVMGVDIPGVVKESTGRLAKAIKAELIADQIQATDVVVLSQTTEVKVESASAIELSQFTINFQNAEQKTKGLSYLEDRYATMLQVISQTDTAITVRYIETYMRDYQERILTQAIETIRNRIDEFGVAEPSIQKQGNDRILVQLPGMADAERAKSLVNTAAKLDFMIVDESLNSEALNKLIAETEAAGGFTFATLKYSEYTKKLNEALVGKIPANRMVLFEKIEGAQSLEVGRIPLLVHTDTDLGGDSLDDAFISFDQYQKPIVSLRFNAAGSVKFKNLTGQNINKRMAIVLDRVIKSAPNIQAEIGGGQAQITLGSTRDMQKTLDEAKLISTALRAGALPASLEQLEERRVGPSLGADSIQKAVRAAFVGAVVILLFMLIRYKQMGLVSDIALCFNILTSMALLSSLGATLTLPGIAGIALTIGFAVDANVLINERIREELAKGASFQLALKEGYNRAMSAILDANATTAATAVVLLYFGTGPVKGFAVTLLIGIATTLFANVFISKVIVENLVYKFNFKKLSV